VFFFGKKRREGEEKRGEEKKRERFWKYGLPPE